MNVKPGDVFRVYEPLGALHGELYMIVDSVNERGSQYDPCWSIVMLTGCTRLRVTRTYASIMENDPRVIEAQP